MENEIKTPCLIIGSGIAGLSSAFALAEQGVECLVISCASKMSETNTSWAQGGIIHLEDASQSESLAHDIYEAGAGINYPPAVEQLVKLGPELVKKILIKLAQVPFDKNSGGEFHFTQEGGHSEPRILHKGDQSGLSIEKGLIQLCETVPKISLR
jgi:L-aspartate oxidase